MRGDELRERLRSIREELNSDHAIRLHRAISWLRCAESYSGKDDDLSFITAWIALNSCYTINDGLEFQSQRKEFDSLCTSLCNRGGKSQLYDSIWNNFPGFVRLLIGNKYLFPPFWKSQSSPDLEWEKKFKDDKAFAMKALGKGDVPQLLSVVFDRLYMLRNQLFHGGATYGSGINRDQVINGKKMLLEIVPIVIETMFDDSADWGEIFFPVIGD